MPEGDAADYIRPTVGSPELSFRPFTGRIRRDWRVASFSRLVAEQGTATRAAPEEPDHDAAFPEGDEPLDEELSGIFAFPRGARAGTFLHSLFEDLSFTAGKKTSKASSWLSSGGSVTTRDGKRRSATWSTGSSTHRFPRTAKACAFGA